ncbi:macrophage mannose receptor 1-like [Anthonomus grandis grandis]|uniref:macrophage mannose receptor 1-like n=1 Tax=Anthonomus grandis grandis TaxID=2921223 RepID=UPI0021663162|nr:macrophage mannose receptor 1-like [Anthonomus grandis grandis]
MFGEMYNSLSYLSLILCLSLSWSQPFSLTDMNLQYHVSTDAQTWYQALINCKGAGMDLVSINSAEEQERLEMFLKENGFNKGYWLSGTNLGNDNNNYSWASTGEPVVYTKWLPGQPDNTIHEKNRGENCIQWGMYEESPEPAGWNDMFCRQKLQYICQESDNKRC